MTLPPNLGIPDYTYYVSDRTLEVVLPPIPVSDPACIINYSLEGGVIIGGATFTTTGFPVAILDFYN
jgi:hypothetical protein